MVGVAAATSIVAISPVVWGATASVVATTHSTDGSINPATALSATTPTTTSTVSSTNTTTTVAGTSGGLITDGPSRSQCVVPYLVNAGLPSLLLALKRFDDKTHTVVTCVGAYLDSAQTWEEWTHPWIASPLYGFKAWIAQKPNVRQLVLGINLIPNNLGNIKNPLPWELSCAAGKFNSYAAQMGTSLVHAGFENSVIRLGPEMNGKWERDYIGDTRAEQRLWADCFANEVSALRQVKGEHFLIDWNPNACVERTPFGNYYPGNAYVDIVGLDLFDRSCVAPYTRYTFHQLANEPVSLTYFENFAASKGKPMSLPEWGLSIVPLTDDPQYVNGIGKAVTSGNYAFEEYFDYQRPQPLLGPKTPLALKAFQNWFGQPN